MKRLYIVFLAALLSMLLFGCALNTGAGVTTPSATAQTTIEPSAEPTPTPMPTPTSVTRERIGFIRDAYTHEGVNYIVIDYVNFLTGDEALDKAKADGEAEQDMYGNWYLPNDYYISNDNALLRTFPLHANCVIKIVDFSRPGRQHGHDRDLL